MSRAISLFLLFITFLSADGQLKSPINKETAEGKSVYNSLKPFLNLKEEVRIQQEDQNITRHELPK